MKSFYHREITELEACFFLWTNLTVDSMEFLSISACFKIFFLNSRQCFYRARFAICLRIVKIIFDNFSLRIILFFNI